ncbi:MAG: AAA family ATPase [Candidatus Binataceae bacterium]
MPAEPVRPWFWLLAGPNGAGKSTYAPNLFSGFASVDEIVRPDEIASIFSPQAPEESAIKAGREAIRRVRDLLRKRRGFAIETTLSGRLHVQAAKQAKSDGWNVGTVYIGLASVELAIERVRQRVLDGGHNVPPADIRRRYERSLNNLAAVCEALDFLIVLDNSSARIPMRGVLEAHQGRTLFKQRIFPKWLRPARDAILKRWPPRKANR